MLCSLIHQYPENIEQAKKLLEHAWFPKGGELGQHSWYDSSEIHWINLPKIGEEFIDLEDISPYFEATGFRKITLDDWLAAISYVADSSGYEDHEIKRSPKGDKLLLLERLPNGIDFAVEIRENGECFFIEKDDSGKQTEAVDQVQIGMSLLEQKVVEITGLSAKWSHVNSTLAKSLTEDLKSETVEKKKGFLARLFGK